MNSKKYLLSILILIAGLVSQIAQADTLGFRAGGGIWQPESSGTFKHGGRDIDLKNDLYLQDEDQQYTYMVLEHPLPMIPNIKVSQTTLSSKGAGDVATDYTFGTTPYTAGTAVTTEMVLDSSDITLYYQLLDNWINFDIGLTARTFDGKVTVTSGGVTELSNVDKTIPMLYIAAGIELPFVSDLFVGVESNVISIDGHTIQDLTTKVSYTTSYLIGFEAGYRIVTMEFDDLGGNSSNMEFSGSFANLYLHF